MKYLKALFLTAAMAAGCGGYASEYRAEFERETDQCTCIRFKYNGDVYQMNRIENNVVIEKATEDSLGIVDWEFLKKKPLEGVVEEAMSIKRCDEGRVKIPARRILE
jgi:hypothetical protein